MHEKAEGNRLKERERERVKEETTNNNESKNIPKKSTIFFSFPSLTLATGSGNKTFFKFKRKPFRRKKQKMKMRAKGFLDFSMDRLTERNKENSFLDVDWIIEELLALGQHRLTIESPTTASTTDLTSPTSLPASEKASTKSSKLKSASETAKSVMGQKSSKRVVSWNILKFHDKNC